MSAGGGMDGMSPMTFLICVVITTVTLFLICGCTSQSETINEEVIDKTYDSGAFTGLDRYVDKEYGVVCYTYSHGISCVDTTKRYH